MKKKNKKEGSVEYLSAEQIRKYEGVNRHDIARSLGCSYKTVLDTLAGRSGTGGPMASRVIKEADRLTK